jgi:hypothetical protein
VARGVVVLGIRREPSTSALYTLHLIYSLFLLFQDDSFHLLVCISMLSYFRHMFEVRFEAFTAATMKNDISWDVTPVCL